MSQLNNQTIALHGGHDVKTTSQTRAVPIYLTSSYVFDNAEQAANRFNLSEGGYIYTRLNNPTNEILENRLAELEGGIGCCVTASGTSATVTALLSLLNHGDHIVASNSLYGGTFNLLNVTLRRFGIDTTFVNANEIHELKNAIQDNTKAIFAEVLGNPKLDILDIEKVSEVAKANEIPLIIDNTLGSPALIQPIKHGANIVIHSLTKYICGNGTVLGGAIIDAGNFNWGNGKFPYFTNPSPAYHGLNYWETLGNASFIARVRLEGLRDLGAALSPLNAFQIIQGLETLDIRTKRYSENALEIAQWLQNQPQVEWVNYPGLKSSKYYDLAKKYFPNGQNGIVTFGVKGGYEAAKRIADETQLFSLVANIGDTKSLIIHPASTTHQQLTPESQAITGVTPDLIRLSIGLENVNDLKQDLENVFQTL